MRADRVKKKSDTIKRMERRNTEAEKNCKNKSVSEGKVKASVVDRNDSNRVMDRRIKIKKTGRDVE